MSKFNLLSGATVRGLALVAITGSAFAVAGAQTVVSSPGQPVAVGAADAAQSIDFRTPAYVPGAGTAPAFSSSVSDTDATGSGAANENLASLETNFRIPDVDAQYGRRRYGAPRYRGSNTNADGSEKYGGYAGAGFASPTGTNSNYLTTSWGFQVGAGRNFNKHFGLNLEFAYDHFGMTGATISNQSYLYFDDPTNPNGLDANSHIWNISLQPVYQIYSGEGLGAYITGGVGFYHKVANFTLPEEEEYCDPFYGCEGIYVNGTVDHYTSNAPGFDGGIGVTYKFSHFSSERLYAEARYVYVDNSYRSGVTDANVTTYTGANYFPQNSNTTSYFPIKFGVRF